MRFVARRGAAAFALSVSFLAGCGTQLPSTDHASEQLSNFDALQTELAARASKGLTGSSANQVDFNVVVTQAEYPIGTLLRQGTTIPVDAAACLPAAQPVSAAMNSMFPNYAMTASTAVDFGLDSAVIKWLASLKVTVKDTDTVTLSFKGVTDDTLTDDDIVALQARAACSAAIASKPVWLVRGYIKAQRTFSLKNDRTNDFAASVPKIGSFEVSPGSGNVSLDITDAAPVGFLQIVSQVQAPTTRAPASIATLSAPTTAGEVYVQKDRNDRSDKSQRIVAAIQAQGIRVEPSVEALDSSKMPATASVRYFHDGDQAAAQRVLAQLQAVFPDARLIRLKLPAPPGQLEVWLPRA
jgi:hypothetical protein